MRSSSPTVDDRTARARIRDAAITLFAADGFAATSVRAIAAEAGVSAGLVIHHFGSKDELRHACDEHVAALIRANKERAMRAGPGLDPVAAIRDADTDVPMARYLASTLTDGTPHVTRLVDELVDDATGYMTAGVEAGMLRPSEHHRARAALLTIWSLGGLVLADHVERLLGIDLMESPAGQVGTPASATYVSTALELLSGMLTEDALAAMRAALVDAPPPDASEAS